MSTTVADPALALYATPPVFCVLAAIVNGPTGQFVMPNDETVASVFSEPLSVTTPVLGLIVPVKSDVATGWMSAATMIVALNELSVMFACGTAMLPCASTVPDAVPVKGPSVVGVPFTGILNDPEIEIVTLPVGATSAPACSASPATPTPISAQTANADDSAAKRRRLPA